MAVCVPRMRATPACHYSRADADHIIPDTPRLYTIMCLPAGGATREPKLVYYVLAALLGYVFVYFFVYYVF